MHILFQFRGFIAPFIHPHTRPQSIRLSIRPDMHPTIYQSISREPFIHASNYLSSLYPRAFFLMAVYIPVRTNDNILL
jgi:hypothetical protein